MKSQFLKLVIVDGDSLRWKEVKPKYLYIPLVGGIAIQAAVNVDLSKCLKVLEKRGVVGLNYNAANNQFGKKGFYIPKDFPNLIIHRLNLNIREVLNLDEIEDLGE